MLPALILPVTLKLLSVPVLVMFGCAAVVNTAVEQFAVNKLPALMLPALILPVTVKLVNVPIDVMFG